MDARVTFAADYVERRSRTTTLARLPLVLPHEVVLLVFAIGVLVIVAIARVAIVVTGRYPRRLYGVVAEFLRYQSRAYAFLGFLAEEWPSLTAPAPPTAAVGRGQARVGWR